MVEVAPLLSSSAIPQIGKIGFSFFISVTIFPWVLQNGYPIPADFFHYALVLLGEVLLGIIIGFFLALIYAAFQVAGQFFSLQMGFGASTVFDPLAQIEIPLMGQLFNVIGMFVFLSVGGFQKFLLVGVVKSFESLKAVQLVTGGQQLIQFLVRGLGQLFENSMIIAFPFLGTLLLISISMGLLAKATPQMNLLMLGFPISIATVFLILFFALPFMVNVFSILIENSFDGLLNLIKGIK